ncbi:MAG: RiPP maturation radical SAM C-methyltransferase [Alcanivoracaceae bacterium]|nr:RiPP maturation radical SAM C-methyltransferase [Alcanivoracaceae bacterium]
MSDVALVTAPFLSILRPALGVSNLTAVLKERHISCEVNYLNISFASLIGADLNEFICEEIPTSFLVGEAIFSDKIKRQGVDALHQYLQRCKHIIPEKQRALIIKAFQMTDTFIDEMAQKLIAGQPRLIGFSSTFQQNCASLAIAKAVKNIAPDIITCFGGANCEGPMGKALLTHFPAVDYVFSGEAENSFPTFLEQLLNNKPISTDNLTVFSRTKPNKFTEPKPVIMDDIPIPEYGDYFSSLKKSGLADRVTSTILFETSRGCWWGAKHHCRFCGLNGHNMNFRSKSPDKILNELEVLSKRWQINHFQAADNIMDLKHVNTVFEKIPERLPNLNFFYEIKANMKRFQLQSIANAGVSHVQPGIESLDDDILKEIEKGVTAAQNISLLRDCAELGIRVIWNILCGLPNDTAEQYQIMAKLIPALEHLDPPSGCSMVRLDRFSPYFQKAKELGYVELKPCAGYAFVYDLQPQELAEMAYFFDAKAVGVPTGDYVKPLRNSIKKWRKNAFESTVAPELKLLSIGTVNLIKDSRKIATSPLRKLSQTEAKLLVKFRKPTRFSHFKKQHVNEGKDWSKAYQRLLKWQYIIEVGGRSVSLVTSPDLHEDPQQEMPIYPGGRLLPINIINA